jgi:hypothetical protein
MKQQNKEVFLVYSLNLSKEEPNRIHPGKPLYFSNREKAEEVIRQFKELYEFLYESSNPSEQVYCLILEEYELDSPYRYQLSTRVYSADGLFLSDSVVPDDGPFLGRQENRIYHEVGDIVEIPYGDQLVFGIVLEQPFCFNEDAGKYGFTASDDCYTVIHYPSHEVDYAHSPLVFKHTGNITEDIREDLQIAFRQITKSENDQ